MANWYDDDVGLDLGATAIFTNFASRATSLNILTMNHNAEHGPIPMEFLDDDTLAAKYPNLFGNGNRPAPTEVQSCPAPANVDGRASLPPASASEGGHEADGESDAEDPGLTRSPSASNSSSPSGGAALRFEEAEEAEEDEHNEVYVAMLHKNDASKMAIVEAWLDSLPFPELPPPIPPKSAKRYLK
ncbi:hypothetical protein PG988_001661 [Apiospora saccharicola]